MAAAAIAAVVRLAVFMVISFDWLEPHSLPKNVIARLNGF